MVTPFRYEDRRVPFNVNHLVHPVSHPRTSSTVCSEGPSIRGTVGGGSRSSLWDGGGSGAVRVGVSVTDGTAPTSWDGTRDTYRYHRSKDSGVQLFRWVEGSGLWWGHQSGSPIPTCRGVWWFYVYTFREEVGPWSWSRLSLDGLPGRPVVPVLSFPTRSWYKPRGVSWNVQIRRWH